MDWCFNLKSCQRLPTNVTFEYRPEVGEEAMYVEGRAS
jgi:hypothetical protein